MTKSQIESWERTLATRNRHERRILEVMMRRPEEGMTAWEIAMEAKLSPAPHRQDVAPRLTELVNAGLVVETGMQREAPTGRNGEVYMLKMYWDQKETAQATCTESNGKHEFNQQ